VHRVLLLAFALGLLAPTAAAAPQHGFAFGRLGGNIQPYTVTIAAGGGVRVSGPVQAGKTMLTTKEQAALTRVATDARFSTLPAVTNCQGSLPDVAATFVRVGGRTVRVHGSCLPRYNRLFTALSRAVKLSG
jgi:hypothetical protein